MLAAFLVLAATATPALPASFKIGLSLPLAGEAALLAAQFLDGARLAVDVLAPEGDIELVVVDDGCDADIAELAAADLRTAGVSLVTGFLCNDAARVAARTFRGTGVPVIVAAARSERLIKDAGKEDWNVWRMAPADHFAAEAAAVELSRRWLGRPWAIVDDGTVHGRTFADEFRTLMEEAGQPPQFVDNFRPAQSTQAGLVRRLQRSGVSAVFAAASAEDTAVIAADMREFDAGFELAGGPPLALLPWIEHKDKVPDGLLAVMQPDPATLGTAKELTLVLDRRGIEAEPYVYLGYAAAELAMAALRGEPDEIAGALGDTVFRTVIGNVDFDEAGRNRINPYRLFAWRDGAFRPAEEALR